MAKGKRSDRRAEKLAEAKAKRDELARLIEAEQNPARKERGRRELEAIDRRIARAESKKFVSIPVLIAIVQAILWLIQYFQTGFVASWW